MEDLKNVLLLDLPNIQCRACLKICNKELHHLSEPVLVAGCKMSLCELLMKCAAVQVRRIKKPYLLIKIPYRYRLFRSERE